ncbi:MAG: glycosyltransferase [Candidatus Sericytochromatia bacterium]|nr:glycosyltransferase [Candidatus Sericytochromatia bacterium]
MRILIWNHTPRDPESAYWFWLKDGMEAGGHQVIALDAHALMAVFGLQGMQGLILRHAEAFQIQAVIVTPQNQVETWLLDRLREMGIAVIAFRYDDGLVAAPGQARLLSNHWRQFRLYDAHCDLAVTFCRGMVAQATERDGTAPAYLPTPFGWQAVSAEPAPLRPVIAYCGSPKYVGETPLSWRVHVMRHLLEAGLPLELHHDDWARVPGCEAAARPTPTLTDLFGVFRTATVNLVLPADWCSEPQPMIKNLNVEIAAAGGMQIAHPCAELADLFDLDGDIATATTAAEIADRARHYLAHPEEARRLGQNSRQALERLGGWDCWWEKVAALLAEKGITLPLDGLTHEADSAIAPELAMANLALAHLYEGAAKFSLAGHYFRTALSLAPDDYHAHAGLARLAPDQVTAMGHWRAAASSCTATQNVTMPVPFAVASLGKLGSACRDEAAKRWVEHALMLNDGGALIEAMDLAIPYQPYVTAQVCQVLAQRRQPELIARLAILHARHWPDSPL